MADDSSVELLRSLQAGEADAAARIHARYVARLTAAARARISAPLARRVDPEDVLQSAWRSFFVRARAGGYQVGRSGDLWSLLSAIVRNKLLGSIERNQAGRRSMAREEHLAGDASNLAQQPVDSEPGPAEAAALADTWEHIGRILSPEERQVFELRLSDYRIEEIAQHLGRSERTVRRWLEEIRGRLARELDPDRQRPSP